MYFRVVRFTDVDPERIEQVLNRVRSSDGPPEGVPATGIQFLYDESQRTMVVLQQFDTAEEMEEGGRALGAIDSSETPGTRVSVDMCELKLGLGSLQQPVSSDPTRG